MDVESTTSIAILDRVYAAPVDPKGWLVVLSHLEEVFPGSVAVLWLPFPGPGGSGKAIAPSLQEQALTAYARDCVSIDPLASQLQRVPVGDFVRVDSLPWLEVASEHPSLLAWIEGQNLLPGPDLLGVIDRQWDCGTSALLLYRRQGAATWSPSVQKQGQHLMPHLKRAAQIHFKMAETRARLDLAQQIVDHLPWAVFSVDASSRVLTMNQAARRLLGQGEGFVLDRTGLRAENRRDTERLRTLVAGAALADLPAPLRVVRIGRSGGTPLDVAIRAISERVPGREGVVADLIVGDPDAPVLADEGLMRELYGLTSGESALALELLQGRRLVEAARRLGIAGETARNRLKQIFVKTGTARQVDLVRQLLRSPIELG